MFDGIFRATSKNQTYGPAFAVLKAEFRKKNPVPDPLPKQWKDWCTDSRLRPYDTWKLPHGMHVWHELIGHGHMWKVNRTERKLIMGPAYENFLTWRTADTLEVPLPTSRAQMREAVKTLLALWYAQE